MRTAVVINEQHNLFPGQAAALEAAGLDYELYKVPATGWTIAQQIEKACEIGRDYEAVVMVSPVPMFMAKLARLVESRDCEKYAGFPLVPQGCYAPEKIFIFSKENRAAKEYSFAAGNVTISSKLSDEFVLVEVV